MINFVQTAEVKTTVIEDLQHQSLSDAEIMQSAQLAFEPVDLLADEVGFELTSTQVFIQLDKVGIHLRELHAGIGWHILVRSATSSSKSRSNSLSIQSLPL